MDRLGLLRSDDVLATALALATCVAGLCGFFG